MQFGHTVGARALKADYDDHVSVQLASAEGSLHRLLAVKHPRRGLDGVTVRLDRAGLEGAAAKIARNQPHPAIGMERRGDRGEDRIVKAGGRSGFPRQGAIIDMRLLSIGGHSALSHGQHIAVGKARIQQFAHDIAHSAGGVEVVHIRRTVGIDPGDQRHRGAQFIEVLPIELDPGGTSHRGNVDRVVG